MYRNRNKIVRALALALALALTAVRLSAGDAATFVDLGFSPDGVTYMFAQYGVQSTDLKPWAELLAVNVAVNDFVPGGRVSLTANGPVKAGHDGAGVLYHLIAQNASLAQRCQVDYLSPGEPLYISADEPGAPARENIEFRDFKTGASYRAVISTLVEGSGATLAAAFHIRLERTGAGLSRTYTLGNAALRRPQVASYRIFKAVSGPGNSLVLVIEMKQRSGDDYNIRYMVETVQL